MPGSYGPGATLAAITDHAAPILVIGGISIVAMWIYFIGAVRMSHLERAGRATGQGGRCSRLVVAPTRHRRVHRALRDLCLTVDADHTSEV